MADLVTRMRLDSSEYDRKVKRAAQNLLDFEAQCRATGQSMNTLSKENLEYVKALGSMQTVSKNARGQISELSSAFTELSMQYKRLSDEEKKGEVGKALAASLGQLKTRITDMKGNLADVNKELGDNGLGSVLDTLGQKFGVTANLTDLLTSKTAMLTGVIGAMAAGVVTATKEWAAYNDELAKQDQQTTVITGLKGSDSNNMTDSARALASVYNVDFRQAIDAANTLMAQFGESGDSAMQILRDGMQGMLQGDGGKLLQMIQQYAPAFHDAGVSASQLVAVIQNSEGGIFTAENMSAIVMGIKNIRLMTNQTREALAKMGIDGEEMSKKMSDGSMTIFDALKQVASKLKDTEAGSKTAGEVMQSVFGRQGAMAGTNLAKAIESLNTNLEETKNQTGEVGQATAKLQTATENLNKAIRDCFEYDGWDVMTTEIKTGLIIALTKVVKTLRDVKDFLTDVEVAGVNLFDTIRTSAINALGPLGKVLNLLLDIKNAKSEAAGIASSAGYGGALGTAMRNKGGGGDGNTPTDDIVPPPNKPTPTNKTTPQEKAAGMAAEAERTYAETLQKSAIRVEAGIDTELQAKKKELSAQERLFDAYNDAYAVYADPKYKEAATDAAEKMKSLAGEVKGMEDAIAESKRTWVQGPSGFNSETMSAWMQGKQSDLNSAEFGSSEYKGISDQMTDMVNLKTVLETALKNGIDTAEFDLSGLYEKIFDAEQPGDIIPDEYWQAIIDQINEKIEEIGGEIKPLKLNVETGKIELAAKEGEKTAKAWSTAASMISTAGSALQSFENPAAKIAGVIAQAIATVALSYSQTLAKDSSSQSNIWSFIAAAAAATISMATTIAAIKSNTSGYAQGGIVDGSGGGFVGGTAYSGDNVGNVRLDSGELVLNRAQQSNLADQLTGGFGDEAAPEVRISGEDLILVMNTSLRRQGFGRLTIGDFS